MLQVVLPLGYGVILKGIPSIGRIVNHAVIAGDVGMKTGKAEVLQA